MHDTAPTTDPHSPHTDAPTTTEVTVSYEHPDNEPWQGPVTYTRPVPAGHLYRLIELLDELTADAV